MIGQVVDRYRIEAKLGEGGMGVVYKARDTQLDRVVAIKILPHDKVSDPVRKQRFIQEARAASALNHSGIVTIHDIRSDAGIDFIVMEHVGGKTLDQMIPAKGLRVSQALRYGVEIADALARAHEAGIIHRDLKPSNVMVTDEGRIKILDFGLAKLLEAADSSVDASTRVAPLTEEGIVMGTAAYMSPEQAEGRKVDGRSDVFSFGAVLYEMVTGRRPFIADSRLSVLAKILNEDPAPPSQFAASVPTDVERTILRCLRKDPARRFQTMADLKVALEDLETDVSSGASVQTIAVRAPSRWRWAWTAILPVLLVAGYFAWQRWPRVEVAAPLRAIPLTSMPGVKRSPSFSADGNQVAFSWTGPKQDNVDVYVQQIGAGSPVRLTSDPADDYSPNWSPDGRTIAFLRRQVNPDRHELRVVPPLGGPDRKLAEIRPQRPFGRAMTLAWCPDSSCLVTTDSPGEGQPDALFVVSVESGEKRQLTRPTSPTFADSDPAVSPDGNWLAFRRDTAPYNGELYVVRLGKDLAATGEPIRLTPTQLFAYNPRWTLDSTEIVFSAKGALWRLGISEGSAPKRLPFVGDDGLMPMSSRSQPGQPTRLVYVRSFTDLNIWRVETSAPGEPTTSSPVLAISSTRRDLVAQFSPDSRSVTFLSDRSGEQEVWRADATGANATQLTSQAAIPGFPRWSPDGELIAYHSNPEGQGEVYVVPAGGGKPRNVTSHPAVDTFPSFSKDGRWIYFSSSRTGEPMIWKIPTAGGEAVKVSPRPGLLAIESADGADLYYVESNSTDRPGPLMRVPVKGGLPIKLLDDLAPLSFDVVDRGVYYLERAAGETRLRYFDFASRRSIVIARNLGNASLGLGASRDGRAILYTRVDSSVDDVMLVENFR